MNNSVINSVDDFRGNKNTPYFGTWCHPTCFFFFQVSYSPFVKLRTGTIETLSLLLHVHVVITLVHVPNFLGEREKIYSF